MAVLLGSPSRQEMVEYASFELRNRKRRSGVMGPGLAGEPAWIMLLDLYVAEHNRQKVQTVYLVEESGAPHATGLRYLSYLTDEQLVHRSISERDRRSKFVELTDRGRALLDRYLSDCLNGMAELIADKAEGLAENQGRRMS